MTTMTQLSLFDIDDEPAIARKSDPITSHAAAEDVKPRISQLQSAFLQALDDLGGGPATAREIAERAVAMQLHKEVESVRKRTAELERQHLIVLAGIQRCSVTGKLAEGWRAWKG
jgi:hypothetical protein